MVQLYSPGSINVPSHVGTLTPSGEYDRTCVSFGPPKSTTQTANPLVQPFLHSSQQKVSILYNRWRFPPKLPLIMGDLDPIYFMITWANPSPQSKRRHDRFSRFCSGDRRVSYTLQWAAPSPVKIAPSHGTSGPPSNTWFPGLSRPESSTQMPSRSVQPFLQGLTLVWQTTLLGR